MLRINSFKSLKKISKVSLALFFCLFINITTNAQIEQVTIHGFISQNPDTTHKLKNAKVYILNQTDTISRAACDENGAYSIKVKLDTNLAYTVVAKCYSHREEVVNIKLDARLEVFDYTINFSLVHFLYHGPIRYPIYSFNEVSKYENFDVLFIVDIIDAYPNMCLELRAIKGEGEKKNINQKRIKHLKKTLIKAGCNMNQILFIDDDLIHGCLEDLDCRGTIEGNVISMDGNCN